MSSQLEDLKHYARNTSAELEGIVRTRKTNIDEKIEQLLHKLIQATHEVSQIKKARDEQNKDT